MYLRRAYAMGTAPIAFARLRYISIALDLQFVFPFLPHFGTGVSKFCEISICRRARALVLSVVTPWAWPLRARG